MTPVPAWALLEWGHYPCSNGGTGETETAPASSLLGDMITPAQNPLRTRSLRRSAWPSLIAIGLSLVLLGAMTDAGGHYFITQDGSTESEGEVVRWGNVKILLRADSAVAAVPDYGPTEIQPNFGQVLLLVKGESRLVIDAETGSVLQRALIDADQAEFDLILGTLTVQSDNDGEGWPYSGNPANASRWTWGNITFISPDPASGLAVFTGIDELPSGAINTLTLGNGNSYLMINADSGEILDENTLIQPSDQVAFDNFLGLIEQAP